VTGNTKQTRRRRARAAYFEIPIRNPTSARDEETLISYSVDQSLNHDCRTKLTCAETNEKYDSLAEDKTLSLY